MGTRSHTPPTAKNDSAWENPHDAGPMPMAPGARPGVKSRVAEARERAMRRIL